MQWSLSMTLAMMLVAPMAVMAEECPPTPGMTSGTHFEPIVDQRIDIGEGLEFAGRVLSSDGCAPIPGARVAHWQADREGIYRDRLRAYLYSGEDGAYRFSTEWPAAMIPHVHFLVSAKGYRTLSTQWVGGEVVDKVRYDIVLQPE